MPWVSQYTAAKLWEMENQKEAEVKAFSPVTKPNHNYFQ
jgi:hypothetical protein